ncbi:hypothetical protein ANTQUA_LOCUS6689 [Anthophora quadrimaculata]
MRKSTGAVEEAAKSVHLKWNVRRLKPSWLRTGSHSLAVFLLESAHGVPQDYSVRIVKPRESTGVCGGRKERSLRELHMSKGDKRARNKKRRDERRHMAARKNSEQRGDRGGGLEIERAPYNVGARKSIMRGNPTAGIGSVVSPVVRLQLLRTRVTLTKEGRWN